MKNRYALLVQENSRNGKLVLLAFVIGLLAGLVSSLLRWILELIEQWKEQRLSSIHNMSWVQVAMILMITILSILAALYLVQKFAPETAGSGIQEIEGTLDDARPLRWKSVLPVKFFASIFSLSSGLLLGREGPTVQLGAAIGKMVKDVTHHPDEGNNPLISAGAAAGLAGAFNAPLSGVIFVIEEMNGHFKFNFYNLTAIMIGAGTSDIIVRLLLGSAISLPLGLFTLKNLAILWFFPVLGLLLGCIGWGYNKMIILWLDIFKKLRSRLWLTALVLSLLLLFAFYISPDMIGAGYNTIHKVMQHSFSFKFLLLLLLVRFILSGISYGSGVPGGLFAPMLTVGIILGMIYGLSVQKFFPHLVNDPGIFALAGMAALFAATVRAPLTGLALAVEMTSNYELILPLILTTVVASITTTMLGNKPIYSILLGRILQKTATKENT